MGEDLSGRANAGRRCRRAQGRCGMKILYVCHRFPFPPRRGGKIRPFNMIRHLTERHDVTVCSLARSPAEAEEARGIAPYCARFFVHEVSNPVQGLRMITRLSTPAPSSMG